MLADLSIEKLLVLVLIGLFVLGPERLPAAVTWVSKTMRQLRRVVDDTQRTLQRDLGPEFDQLREPLRELREPIQQLRALHSPTRTLGQYLTTPAQPASAAAPPAASSVASSVASASAGVASAASAVSGSSAGDSERPPAGPPPIDPDAT